DHLLEWAARGPRLQAVSEGEHLPAAQGGARERDAVLRGRLHERRRQGGHPGVQGEAPAGVEGPLSGRGPRYTTSRSATTSARPATYVPSAPMRRGGWGRSRDDESSIPAACR